MKKKQYQLTYFCMCQRVSQKYQIMMEQKLEQTMNKIEKIEMIVIKKVAVHNQYLIKEIKLMQIEWTRFKLVWLRIKKMKSLKNMVIIQTKKINQRLNYQQLSININTFISGLTNYVIKLSKKNLNWIFKNSRKGNLKKKLYIFNHLIRDLLDMVARNEIIFHQKQIMRYDQNSLEQKKQQKRHRIDKSQIHLVVLELPQNIYYYYLENINTDFKSNYIIICFLIIMSITEELNKILKKDINICTVFSLKFPKIIKKDHYLKLINWIYQVNLYISFFFSFLFITQHTQSIQMHDSTQFKTKLIIDLYLMKCQELSINHYQLLGITAIILSFRIFQNYQYPYNFAIINTKSIYSQNQIKQFENTVIQSISIPFDFFEKLQLLNNSQNNTWDNHFVENVILLIKLISVSEVSFGKSSLILLIAAISSYLKLFREANIGSLSDEVTQFVQNATKNYNFFKKNISQICEDVEKQFSLRS